MQKTQLVIGTYNHLPEGLDDTSFEAIYQSCYRPFLSVLNRFPEIQAALYYSGSLMKRFEEQHPEYLMLLEEMSGRRQIELLGGGFYAPVLPLVPGSDRLGQIELMTTYLRKAFGKRPRGAWLTEYAWEPWLASTLRTSGMDYTFLSAEQFKEALGRGDLPLEPVVTEDQGRCLVVLPVYDCASSFGPEPVGFVEAAEALAKESVRSPLYVMMQPGEGIRGLWEASGLPSPDVYIERTFAWLRKNALESETTTPSRYERTSPPSRKLYFPGSASALFTRAGAFPGSDPLHGCVRRAIIRYASSAALNARMYHVHLVISQLRGDKSRKKTAIEDLWRGQCGDAYWMSAAKGIADPSVRAAAYEALIDAEMTTRIKGSWKPGIIKSDIDFDGAKEYLYQGADLDAYLHTSGAAIFELDSLKARRNLCDVFVDAPEGDRSRKTCFIDRVYASEPDASRSSRPWTGDIGVFSGHAFSESGFDVERSALTLSRDGLADLAGAQRSLGLSKSYAFHKKTVTVSYRLSNRSDAEAVFWLGVECNLSTLAGEETSVLADGASVDVAALASDSGFDLGGSQKLTLKGSGPVHAVTLSSAVKAGCRASTIMDRRVQGVSLLLCWPIRLGADETWSNELSIAVQD